MYDYKNGGSWFIAAFLFIWGGGWFAGWFIPALSGPVPGKVNGKPTNFPPSLCFAVSSLGLIALGSCFAILLKAFQEKVVIENGDLYYFDWQGKQKIHCQLKDVRAISLTDQSAMIRRNSPRIYRVDTSDGSFTFAQGIRNGNELFDTLTAITKPHNVQT